MRFLEWLIFLEWLSGDRNRKVDTSGCLPLILIILFFATIHVILGLLGIDDGINKLFRAYLFISIWDIFISNPELTKKGIKLAIFIGTLIVLLFISIKYLLNDTPTKGRRLKQLALYSFVIPHIVILMVRILFTI